MESCLKRSSIVILMSLPFLGGCTEKYALREQAQERMIANLQAEKQKLAEELDEEQRRRETAVDALRDKDGALAALRRDNQDLQAQLDASKTSGTARPANANLEGMRGVSARNVGGAAVISLDSGITFASGQATLSAEGQSALRRIAQEIRGTYAGRRVWIEGHTDNEPIRKSKFRSNLELSIARALSVFQYLTKSGVSEGQLVVAGYGEHNPVASNRSADGRTRNRRVQLIVEESITGSN